jgi:hypothetical protein
MSIVGFLFQAIEALRFCLSRRPPAVKREAEEDWGAKRRGRGQRLWSRASK